MEYCHEPQEDLDDGLHHAGAGRALKQLNAQDARSRSPSTSARASTWCSRSTAITCRASSRSSISSQTIDTAPFLAHGRRPALHPQFLDHRAHRSRQVDARRPPPRRHRRAHRARAQGAVPRQHGPRARARHHHQGAVGAPALPARRRPGLRSQPHRHARPRRLPLRGVALARPPARARCWSSTPRRASRRRRWPTSTSRSTTTSTIVPVLNKIDLPSADPEGAKKQIEEVIGIDASDAILASAKTGIGIHEILEAVVTRIPPPKGDPEAPLQALIFDSWYDTYRGVVMLVRVVDGTLRQGQKIRLLATRTRLTRSSPSARSRRTREELESCRPGEVGFVTATIKEVADAHVGDTITEAERPGAGAARLQAGQADGVRRHLPDRLGALRGPARRAREAARSTTRRSPTSPRPRRRSASASAAASSACCTWRSSRSGSSASTTSTSSPPRRRCATACVAADGDRERDRQPGEVPDRGQVSTTSRSRSSPPPSTCRRSTSAT